MTRGGIHGPRVLVAAQQAAPMEYWALRAAATSTVQASGLLHDVRTRRDVHPYHLRILEQQVKTAAAAESMNLQALAGAMEQAVDKALDEGGVRD